MKKYLKQTLMLVGMLAVSMGYEAPTAQAELAAVGPISPVNGYPVWYQDTNGLSLELGLDPQFNVFDPPIEGNEFSEEIGFGAEGFYWIAETDIPLASGGTAFYEAALEYAFASADEDPEDGTQVVFSRIRIRIDTPVAGTFIITHPFGVEEFEVAVPGIRAINVTTDIGATPLAFEEALGGNIGPFLVALDPPPPEGFIGGGIASSQTVTGSPFDTNFFRVEGPSGSNLGGTGVDEVETDQFALSGKVFGGNIPPFAINDTVSTEEELAVQINVLANDLEIDGTLDVTTVTIVTPPANGVATVNLDGSVSFTPNTGFVGLDSFTYTVADDLALMSKAATVNVSVLSPTCGNGLLQTGEECDDLNTADDDGCNRLCRIEFCGDGEVNNSDTEQCDDGNLLNGDGCNTLCQQEFCGDGLVNDGGDEVCDDGNTVSGDGCDNNCRSEFCGDGVVNNGLEQCDDGNTADDDGCNSLCQSEFCGDDQVNNNGAEQCDDGNLLSGDGCSGSCQKEVCGDGVVNDDGDEECDDGNTADDDGCDHNCEIEEPEVVVEPEPANNPPPPAEPSGATGSDESTVPQTEANVSGGGGCTLIPVTR